MRKVSTIAMALTMGLMMLVSCNKEKESNNEVVFHASIESRTQDRTYLDPDGTQGFVKWMAGDQIRIYNGNFESAVFTLKSGANTTDGTFTYAGEFDMEPPYLAVYPSTTGMNDAGMVVFEVPAVQNLTEPGTFANGANPMLSYTPDDNLQFRNLCGGLGIRLYGENVHVSRIVVKGVDWEYLNGTSNVNYEYNPDLVTSLNEDGTSQVTLTCDVTVPAGDTLDFYAVLMVGALHNGVIVEIYDGETMVGQIPLPEGSDAEVERNKIKSFRPVEIAMPDTHEYVDLGLPSGLLWATCNVGADTPEGYGDYFAWGETAPKDDYNWSTYQYANGTDWEDPQLTKYCQNSSDGYNGFTDTLTILLPEDDAATVNWGGNWRMPTKAEWLELYNNTTVIWTQQGGVNGRLFTASNGNTLFLPAAGYYYSDGYNDGGGFGHYWSSSLNSGRPTDAWHFFFSSGYNGMNDYFFRFDGMPVRSVRAGSQN